MCRDGRLNCHRNPAGEPICSSRFVNCQYRGRDGHLNCHRNPAGEPICSPRFVNYNRRGGGGHLICHDVMCMCVSSLVVLRINKLVVF